jgi:hypothetical protein
LLLSGPQKNLLTRDSNVAKIERVIQRVQGKTPHVLTLIARQLDAKLLRVGNVVVDESLLVLAARDVRLQRPLAVEIGHGAETAVVGEDAGLATWIAQKNLFKRSVRELFGLRQNVSFNVQFSLQWENLEEKFDENFWVRFWVWCGFKKQF